MDITTIVILVIVGLLLLYLFRRNQSAANTGSGSQMGSERPIYDDRNIQGQGSFGTDNSNNNYMPADRRAEDLRDAIDPSVQRNQSHSQTSSERDRTGAGAVNSPSERNRTSSDRHEPTRTDDSPNVQGQGSFGRDKS